GLRRPRARSAGEHARQRARVRGDGERARAARRRDLRRQAGADAGGRLRPGGAGRVGARDAGGAGGAPRGVSGRSAGGHGARDRGGAGGAAGGGARGAEDVTPLPDPLGAQRGEGERETPLRAMGTQLARVRWVFGSGPRVATLFARGLALVSLG